MHRQAAGHTPLLCKFTIFAPPPPHPLDGYDANWQRKRERGLWPLLALLGELGLLGLLNGPLMQLASYPLDLTAMGYILVHCTLYSTSKIWPDNTRILPDSR